MVNIRGSLKAKLNLTSYTCQLLALLVENLLVVKLSGP